MKNFFDCTHYDLIRGDYIEGWGEKAESVLNIKTNTIKSLDDV